MSSDPRPWSTQPITHAQHIAWLKCGAKMPSRMPVDTVICDREPGHVGGHQASRFERGCIWTWWDRVEYVYGKK